MPSALKPPVSPTAHSGCAGLGKVPHASRQLDLEAELRRLKNESAAIAARGPPPALPQRRPRPASASSRLRLSDLRNVDLEAELSMLSREGEHRRAHQHYASACWKENECARKLSDHYDVEDELRLLSQDSHLRKFLRAAEMQDDIDQKIRSMLYRNAYYEAQLHESRLQSILLGAMGDVCMHHHQGNPVLGQQHLDHVSESNELERLSRIPLCMWNDLNSLEFPSPDARLMPAYNSEFGVGWRDHFTPDQYEWYVEEQREHIIQKRLEDALDMRLGLGTCKYTFPTYGMNHSPVSKDIVDAYLTSPTLNPRVSQHCLDRHVDKDVMYCPGGVTFQGEVSETAACDVHGKIQGQTESKYVRGLRAALEKQRTLTQALSQSENFI
jgi:hypothetical protein